MLGFFLSPHWCKQSTIWPSADTELILVVFARHICVCLCMLCGPVPAVCTAFAFYCICMTRTCLYAYVVFVLLLLHILQHPHPQAAVWDQSAEESWLLHISLFWTQQGRYCTISPPNRKPIEYICSFTNGETTVHRAPFEKGSHTPLKMSSCSQEPDVVICLLLIGKHKHTRPQTFKHVSYGS